MLVPLYETVYDRVGIGPHTRLLGLGCGTGLALLLASRRGAAVTGLDSDESRLAVARDRLLPDGASDGGGPRVRRPRARLGGLQDRPIGDDFDVITALDPVAPAEEVAPALAATAAAAAPGSTVVLTGWGPPERCATARVLRLAARLAEPRGPRPPGARLGGRDVGARGDGGDDRDARDGRDDPAALEHLARDAGLRPDGTGQVSCPFGYPDLPSAVRGLLSTRLFDAAIDATDRDQVDKEITEALHPYRRPNGTVRMDNVFRYLVARV